MKFPRPRKGIPTAVRSSAHRLIDGWVDHVESAPTSAHSAVIGLGVWRKPVISHSSLRFSHLRARYQSLNVRGLVPSNRGVTDFWYNVFAEGMRKVLEFVRLAVRTCTGLYVSLLFPSPARSVRVHGCRTKIYCPFRTPPYVVDTSRAFTYVRRSLALVIGH